MTGERALRDETPLRPSSEATPDGPPLPSMASSSLCGSIGVGAVARKAGGAASRRPFASSLAHPGRGLGEVAAAGGRAAGVAARRSAAASPRGAAPCVMAAAPASGKTTKTAASAPPQPTRASGLLCTSITASNVEGCLAEIKEASTRGGPDAHEHLLASFKFQRRRRDLSAYTLLPLSCVTSPPPPGGGQRRRHCGAPPRLPGLVV